LLAYRGDPAFALIPPTEQFRASYSFLAPSTITYNYVNITKKVGAGSPVVYLDGAPVDESEFSNQIGSTDWGVARISIEGTHHTIDCDQTVGIVVYGVANYTSYSYPGGLNLEAINVL
jgi:hypothetical protein